MNLSKTANPITAEVFYSKRDWWATLMVWGMTIFCWVFGIKMLLADHLPHNQILDGVITLLAGMAAPWFWLTTRYRLGELTLTLLSGPFFKQIAYADICSVKDGRGHWGTSFAFSIDCLQVDIEGSRLGYRVSPKDRRGFLLELDKHCDHLVLMGNELVLKHR